MIVPTPTEAELEVMEAEFKAAERLLADFRMAQLENLRALQFRRSDFPRLERDRALGETRFEDILSGGAVPINFKSALTRFAKQRLPGFRSQKAYEGFEFVKPLGEHGQIFVRLEKTFRTLGKVYIVFLGFRPPHVPSMATPMVPLLEFYDASRGGWSYRTADDLDATLDEVARLLAPLLEPLEQVAVSMPEAEPSAVVFGPLSFREAVMAAAPILARRAPGCTFLSNAWFGSREGIDGPGRIGPGERWVLDFDDLVRCQSLRVTLPYSGEASLALRDDISFSEGKVQRHRLHQPSVGELLMLPDLDESVSAISRQLELTLGGLADSPELFQFAVLSRKESWSPSYVTGYFRRHASDAIDEFAGWTFDFQKQPQYERVECAIDTPARLRA